MPELVSAQSVVFDSRYWLLPVGTDEGPHPTESAEPKSRNERLAWCVTMYNEVVGRLLDSLHCIASAITAESTPYVRLQTEHSVCLIIDGLGKLSHSTRDLLVSRGLISESCLAESPGLHVFESLQRCSDWSRGNALSASGSRQPAPESAPEKLGFRLFVCIKSRNHGKLNSHWWFFDRLCRRLEPTYCIQMDVGTQPFAFTPSRMIHRMQTDCTVGAVASCILLPEDSNGKLSLLQLWQCGDFLYQRLMQWPCEEFFGYLSVIPGQLGMFRWDALSMAAPVSGGHADASRTTPLARYFRGTRPTRAMETIMFLAEDRVLGFEIFNQPGHRWQLRFEPAAFANTDYCNDLRELLKQRRRWCNSSMICDLWLVRQLAKRITNSPIALSSPRHAATIAWTLTNLLLLCLQPAVLISLVSCSGSPSAGSSEWRNGFLAATPYICGVVLGTQIALATIASWNISQRGIAIVFWTAVLTFSALLTLGLLQGNWAVIVLYVVDLASMAGIAASKSIPSSGLVARTLPAQILLRGSVSSALIAYSLGRLDDCSWGTKGLTEAPQSGRLMMARLSKVRHSVVAAWIAANTALALASTLWLRDSPVASAVLLTMCIAYVGIRAASCVTLFYGKRPFPDAK